MNELQRIQDQIARFLDGEAWHGPALMEVLSGVDARAAMARPISNVHTIWKIRLHVSALYDVSQSSCYGWVPWKREDRLP